MAKGRLSPGSTIKRDSERQDGGKDRQRLRKIGAATSQIVQEAAALLDEEVAVGIVAAKKMQERFQNERRIDPGDFKEVLQRFQGDAHEIVNLVQKQFAELRSEENVELSSKLTSNTHDLIDVAVSLITLGAEIVDQIAEKNLPKPKERPGGTRRG